MESMAEGMIKDLVASGHALADDMTGAPSVLVRCLAAQLEVQLVRANELAEDHQRAIESIKQADAAVKLAHEKFSALAAENELARKAVQAFCDVVGDNTEIISELVGQDGVLVILEAMKATGNMPATDAFLAEVRAVAFDELRAAFVRHAKVAGLDDADTVTLKEVTEALLHCAEQLREGGNQ
ncbi:ead/Ea22-like family protein [Escherichia coli]|uniref:ead/Ea22-like family protein n=1 Tax=Escherichia coli TaxID=562 RepID=UPI001E30E8AE|nr:ead/Ea22-like family protein [Escherichia coli]MCC4640181.1 ead/Ea22-like family protein [Escherichia coli]